MQIQFYDLGSINEEKLKFAVISAVYKGKWVYVRHKERKTWEIAGGHRESGETIEETAKRELFEETGGIEYNLFPVCDYSMEYFGVRKLGRLFFARIKELGQLPNSEISEVKMYNSPPINLTYIEIQPKLYEKTLEFIKNWEHRYIDEHV